MKAYRYKQGNGELKTVAADDITFTSHHVLFWRGTQKESWVKHLVLAEHHEQVHELVELDNDD
jgi:predicted AAA+ superfamily ATPase